MHMYRGKKVLVIIPAYNESHNIEDTLQSLLEEEIEVDYLVINDCSKDNTLDILKKLNSRFAYQSRDWRWYADWVQICFQKRI